MRASTAACAAAWLVGVVSVAAVGGGIALAGDSTGVVLAAATKSASIEQLEDVPPPGLPAGLSGLERGERVVPVLRRAVANADPAAEIPATSGAGTASKAPPTAFPAAEWVPVGTFPYDEGKVAFKAALDRFVKAAPGASHYRFAAGTPLKQRGSIARFYATHDYSPVWVEDGQWTSAARSVLETITRAADDGLDLSAYPIPPSPGTDSGSRLSAELALSEAVAAYGYQATGGRIDPSRLSLQIAAKPALSDAGTVLDPVVRAADPGHTLLEFNPPQREYAALRDKLAELRGHATVDGGPIPTGPVLRVGMRDPRVSLIRARFGLTPTIPRKESVYDTVVASAVADFQRANGLPPSGTLTVRTVAALSGTQSRNLVNEIIANMERWRWVPRDMGSERIEVNVPDYALKVYRDGEVVHEARVIVGKPDTPTPIFSDHMGYVTINPSWYVPPSIIQKELLPRASIDPRYLTRLGYEVIHRGKTLIVRQPPGDRNALGHVLFMFPNRFAVYLHDTPARGLFGAPNRAFSHGCVRVDQPMKLAAIVLGAGASAADGKWSEERLKGMIGPREKTVFLQKSLPVHLTYFTATVDDGGRVKLRNDLYGYSKRVRTALGLEG